MIRPRPPKPILNPVYGPGAKGVAGWLGLLWLSLVFLLPGLAGLGAYRIYNRPGLAFLPANTFQSLEMVQWSAAFATAFLCWFLAWGLSKREEWRSVEIAILGLWAYALIIKGGQLVGISIATGTPLLKLVEGGGLSVLVPVMFAAIWTLYLLRSQRVARTYPRPAQAEVFE